uniref:Regulatory protein RecX n=1 Tax=Vitis vinifera TaxID=29760 RepID=F6I584_VITVI
MELLKKPHYLHSHAKIIKLWALLNSLPCQQGLTKSLKSSSFSYMFSNLNGVLPLPTLAQSRRTRGRSPTLVSEEWFGLQWGAMPLTPSLLLKEPKTLCFFLVSTEFAFTTNTIFDLARGLINDALYAETFSRSRWSSSSWGPRRIKQALFKKGVSEADAEKAVKLVFKDDGSGGDQESRHGLSNLAMDHLFVQASKQWLRGHDVPRETRKSRIIRWLQYRGFTWAVVSFILKKLESQYPH